MSRALRGIVLAVAAAGSGASEGAELIGTRAPEWDVAEWIGSPPLELSALRGKIVLVRWFTPFMVMYRRSSSQR